MTTKVDGLAGLIADEAGSGGWRSGGSVPIGGARPLTNEEREGRAQESAIASPVGIPLMVAGAIVQFIPGLLVPFAPLILMAFVTGFIEWSTLRMILAWVVGASIITGGITLSLAPYAALIARSNADVLVIRDEAGHEQVAGWTRRPWLGFVIVLPIAFVAWLVASVAFHWIMPG